MKYRKKPIIVEAEQWLGPPEGFYADGNDYVLPFGVFWNGKQKKFYLDTLEGPHEIQPNDFIVVGVSGERYPVKPDIFEKTYELVSEERNL